VVSKNGKYYLAASVSLITFIVFFASLRNDFVLWDDNKYVYENPYIRSFNPAFFKWAFLDFYASNWHPLTWISHALDYAVWGLNPLGHHLTNNIIHAINTFLVVILAIRLIEAARGTVVENGPSASPAGRFTLIAGGMTGLLFGLHPVHVESVAWVAERKDLLCALFFLLSVMFHARYAGRAGNPAVPRRSSPLRNGPYLFSLGFFVLALLSKPMAVSLPLVLLVMDWYPFKRIQSARSFLAVFLEKLPFMALSLASSVLTILAQKTGGAMRTMEVFLLPARLLIAAKALIVYLWRMLVPAPLIPYYAYPKNISLSSPEYPAAVVLVVVITAACLVMAKRQRFLLAVWACYVLTLVPVLGIVQVGGQAMADRYEYLPSIGPFLLLGLSVAWVHRRASYSPRKSKLAGLLAGSAVFIWVLVLAFLTIAQTAVWKNSMDLWSYVIHHDPKIPFAYLNRGSVYDSKGRFNQAIDDYNAAIDLDPGYYEAYVDRGNSFDKMGQFERAISDYSAAIALQPRYFKAYLIRGGAYVRNGRFDMAIEDFDQAIAFDPLCYEAYTTRGISYRELGLFNQAIESFNGSIAIQPLNADAYGARGLTYALMRDYDKALEDFNMAISLNNKAAAVYFNRGNLYYLTGRMELAGPDFQKACDLGDQGACGAARAMLLPAKSKAR
jgi:tetratricopeptide (TPR) repeat protein